MNNRFDTALSVALVGCALVTTGVVVYRQFFVDTQVSPVVSEHQKPLRMENWRSYFAKGAQIGPSGAPIELVEFADFECPFCASLHTDLKTLRRKYPNKIAIYYVHFPLPMHRFAEPAARAAECAGEQGRFEPMHDLLFEQQAAFGIKPWTDFASEAAIPDISKFDDCIQRIGRMPRIVEGQKLAQQLKIPGTPTLIINGWRLGRPPSAEELDNMARMALAGKDPIL